MTRLLCWPYSRAVPGTEKIVVANSQEDQFSDRSGACDYRQDRVAVRLKVEQNQLPPPFVECADGGGGQGELVGQKEQILAGLRVMRAKTAQVNGVILTAVIPVEGDGLVCQSAGLFVDLLGVDASCS